MKIEKRRRGRPKGASRYNERDAATLKRVAAMMVRDDGLAATTAMRRLGKDDEASLRRLQRKWKMRKSEYLQTALSEYQSDAVIRAQERMATQLAVFAKQMEPLEKALRGIDLTRHTKAFAVFDAMQNKRKAELFPDVQLITRALQPSPEFKKALRGFEKNFESMRALARTMQGIKLNPVFDNKIQSQDLFRKIGRIPTI